MTLILAWSIVYLHDLPTFLYAVAAGVWAVRTTVWLRINSES